MLFKISRYKMNRKIFLKWLKINTMFFMCAFFVALLLALLFPDTMLGFVREWGAQSNLVSSTLFGDGNLFIRIFSWNSLLTALLFVVSLFILAPLIAVIMGAFYSLGLMSAIERGLFWHSSILIAIETSFILLAITFASALGSEIFGVNPERKGIMNFWRKNWKKLIPEQKRNWRTVFGKNKREIIFFVIIILALLLFGAWFEALI